jgi:hypothetical protein
LVYIAIIMINTKQLTGKQMGVLWDK